MFTKADGMISREGKTSSRQKCKLEEPVPDIEGGTSLLRNTCEKAEPRPGGETCGSGGKNTNWLFLLASIFIES